jgi:hypothetical protein
MFSLKQIRTVDLFDAWMFAAADATMALRGWMSAPYEQKRDAYAAYLAALDREAHAAGLLQGRLQPTGAG